MMSNKSELREELSSKLLNLIEEQGISRSDAARDIGISDATLSLWLSNKYEGSVANINKDVKNFLEREKEKSESATVEIKFIITTTAKRIIEVARLCHLDREFGVIYGEAGHGKTWAAMEYVKRYPDAILVETDPGWTERVIVKKIHRKLGMDGKGNTDGMMAEIISRLEGTGRFIIIDEAENLNSEVINLVRRIYDHAHIGILLIGMPRLVHNLRGRKGELSQIYSRSSASYLTEYLKSQDTEAIVKSCIPDCSNEVWETFHQESGGNTRVLSKLILRAIRFAELNNSPVNPGHVKDAKRFITV